MMHIKVSHKAKDLADKSESNQRIYYFLKAHPIGVLSTVDPSNNPHSAVIYFDIARDFTVTFVTNAILKKVAILCLITK